MVATYNTGFYAPGRGGVPRHSWMWSRGAVGIWNPSFGQTGNKLFDWSGNHSHGTFTNMNAATAWEVVNGRTAIKFDGTNDYISIPSTQMKLTRSCTICCSFMMSVLKNYNGIFSRTNGNYPAPFDIYVDSGGTMSVFIGNGTAGYAYTTLAGFSAGVQYNLVLVIEHEKMRMYLDGIQRATLTLNASTPFGDNGNPILIGSRNDGATMLNGYVMSAEIFNMPMTSSQVSMIHKSPSLPYQLARRKSLSAAAVALGSPWYYYANQG